MTTDLQEQTRPPHPRSGELHLRLIDGFSLTHGTTGVRLPFGAQRLVAYLALQERAVRRSHVAGGLWLDTSDARAAACLRSALWRLHETGHDVLISEDGCLRLSPTVAVDLRDALGAAADLLDGHPADRPHRLLLSLLGRDLLPDWYDEWVIFARERFRQLRLHALEVLCRRLTAAGEFQRAVEAGLSAVACEPLRESAQVVLIQAHLAEGNFVEALRQFRLYERLLATELGIEPSQRIRRVMQPVRS